MVHKGSPVLLLGSFRGHYVIQEVATLRHIWRFKLEHAAAA